MRPWYIATTPFSPAAGAAWKKYSEWSRLTQLTELVSLDPMLCPTLLPEIEPDFWPHIVNEDFMLQFFTDLDFPRQRLPDGVERNLLCVYRNPPALPVPPTAAGHFDFLGFDLVDVQSSARALSNCVGFPEVFDDRELSSRGLLTSLDTGRVGSGSI